MTDTAAHASTSQAEEPAFAAVIFDLDGVVTDTAGLHAAASQALSRPGAADPSLAVVMSNVRWRAPWISSCAASPAWNP